jgi:hypothetical protein
MGQGLSQGKNAMTYAPQAFAAMKEAQQKKEGETLMASILGGQMGGTQSTPQGPMARAIGGTPMQTPPVASGPITQNPQGLPPGIINAVDRVDPQGPHAALTGAISTAAQQHGVDPAYMKRLAEIESGYGTNLANPNSSARGPFQFISSTAKQYGLENPMDFNQSADAAARFTNDNKAALTQALGREPSAAEMYLAHQQGAGGAIKLLSNPSARAADIVGEDAVRLNGGDPSMSAMDFAGLWAKKFGGAQAAPQQALQPMSNGIDPARLMKVMMHPGIPDAAKQFVMQQYGPKDPMDQVQLQLAQAQLAQMQNPQPGYTQVSGADLGMGGELSGAMFNVGPDGRVSQIGGGGTNVSVNTGSEVGTIPQGYEMFTDPETGARSLRPIAGGPEDASKQEAVLESNQSIASDIIVSAADKARQAAGKRDFGAAGTTAVGMLPWTDSAEVVRNVNTLKAQASASNLNAMRQASKTGGALGNVTEKELKLLENMSGALDPNSPSFTRDLDEYERTLLRIVHGKEAGDAIFQQSRSTAGGDEDLFKKYGLE